MAKKRRKRSDKKYKKSRQTDRVQRDNSYISTDLVRLDSLFDVDKHLKERIIIDDRRRFDPSNRRHSRNYDGTLSEFRQDYNVNKPVRNSKNKWIHRPEFKRPKKVLVCMRRAERRSELFKRGTIGSGRSTRHFKDRVLNDDSKISCKRR